jgi:Fic family protein
MLDDNWELINGPVAHEIEVINYGNQVNLIEALMKFAVHHDGVGPQGCPRPINTRALKELHRTGTVLLLDKPGEYRTVPVHLKKPDGTIVHQPPPAEEVPELMDGFERALIEAWGGNPVEIAAFALWRLNWIHPFKNGNGRTARAFAYACLCQKLGFVLPGEPTVIDQIMNQREDYYAALRRADIAFEETGTPDLSPMTAYLTALLMIQLNSVPATQT